jgi:Deacetylases, including yeast histone deacetylase and acetoin utilization protein
MPVTAYLTHPVCLQHDMGAGHPECPQRLSAINDALVHARVMDFLRCREAKPVEVHQLDECIPVTISPVCTVLHLQKG